MTVSTVAVEKSKWRRRLKARLELLKPWESTFIGERRREHLKLYLSRHPGIWTTYHALPGEADPAIGAVEGIEWVYPRMHGDSLMFHRTDSFVKGPFGIIEPHETAEIIDPGLITGMLVPGLAFDREGRRLGRGRGFYDRTLAGFAGPKVGVAFSAQLVERIPTDPWDVKLDAIITEASVINIRSRNSP